MDSNRDRRDPWYIVAGAVLASAALVWLGTGITPHAWATWLAPLPVLLIAPRLSAARAVGVAALAWLAGSFNAWRYLRHILVIPGAPHRGPAAAMPVLLALAILLVPAIAFAVAALLARGFARRGAPWRAALVFPSAWVAYEYLAEAGSPHSTFGNLAYSQMDWLAVVQVASVTGIWGISFCVLLFSSTLAALARGEGSPRRRLTLAIGAASLLAAVFAFGFWRLGGARDDENAVRVGLLASDLPQNVFPLEGAEATRLFTDYAAQADSLAARGARIVILPEKLAVVVDPATRELDGLFQPIADRHGATIVVGEIHVTPAGKLNEARVYSPAAAPVLAYAKHHLLPAFESSFQPGTSKVLLSEPGGVWGVAICKDMDFPSLARGYEASGAGLLLVPAWDFVDDAWLHDRMAVLRGVESGFSIARAAKQGLLTASDDRGRILAESASAAAPFSTLIANLPVRHDETLYARFGDWFPRANLLLLASILLSAGWSRPARRA